MSESKTVKRTPFIAKVGAAVIAILLIRHTFGGIIRYGLSETNLSFLWFAPDALVSVALALSFFAAIRSKELLRRVVLGLSLVLLALPAITGYANGNNLLSIVSGYKIIAPLVLCLNTPFLLREMTKRYFWLWCALLAVTLAFLIADQFIDYPWVGDRFVQFGVEREVSRQWWATYAVGDGSRVTLSRQAGATVASMSAGALLVMFYALIRTRLKNIWIELLIVLACLYGVFLTDSKTTYFCILLVFICGNLPRLPDFIKNLVSFDVKAGVQQTLSWALLAVGFIPMIIGFTREASPYYAYNSFMDRINFTWPSSMARMGEIGGDSAYIWGAGYGSFGSPSYYSGKYIATTAAVDNFMLYQYAICGGLALILYYLLARVATRAEGTALALFAALIPYSFATSNEGPECLLLAGLALSNALYATRIQWLPFQTGIKFRY
ncbi:hypothetical protein [Asticcacaulis sp. AND118]|uniref:hypothetical protein n=1 Tax=Asticcacaulis sp. AND118 TaxID=2840468 RepID=UPI001CFFCF4E|nr:hypothetical protein [Asticcacaulis sp. AND118]UDF05048.1 hypothetical protein LH365_16790 [Asticcacaulis sp. AND118]